MVHGFKSQCKYAMSFRPQKDEPSWTETSRLWIDKRRCCAVLSLLITTMLIFVNSFCKLSFTIDAGKQTIHPLKTQFIHSIGW